MTPVLSFDWQSLATRSRLLRVLAILLALLLIMLLGWFAALRETQNAYRLAGEQARDALQAIAMRKAEIAGLEPERAALASARLQLQETRWRLDAGEGMSELLEQLAVSGHEHGLLFEHIEVLQESQSTAGYRRVPLDIRVLGHYPALRGWLEQWQQQLRLLQVAQLSLAQVIDKPGLVRAQLRVHAYHAGELLPVPSSLADEPSRPPLASSAFDPFQPWRSGPSADGLGRVPLEQMEMVGSLSTAGRYQALVSVAGHLHRVSEGQRLGRDEGVVVRIDEQRMEVRERLYMAGGWQQRLRYLALGKSARGEGRDDEGEAGRGLGVAAADGGLPRADSAPEG